jgi:hypothetical protein
VDHYASLPRLLQAKRRISRSQLTCSIIITAASDDDGISYINHGISCTTLSSVNKTDFVTIYSHAGNGFTRRQQLLLLLLPSSSSSSLLLLLLLLSSSLLFTAIEFSLGGSSP